MDPTQGKPAEIQKLLTDVIPSLLSSSREAPIFSKRIFLVLTVNTETPFLQGRSFVFASQYAKILPEHLAGQYLSAAIEVMEASDSGIPIKLSAVKAVNKFVLQFHSWILFE